MPYRQPKIEVRTTDKMQDITPFVGLLPIVELWNQLQLPQIIDTSIGVRKDKGYTDSEQLLSLALLNLSGGSAVEHLKFLKEQLGMKSFPLPFPSPTSARDYARHRGPGQSFVELRGVARQLLIPELIEDWEPESARVKKLHLTEMEGRVYKVFGIVTNIVDREGGAIICWQRERCGKSEEVHQILKEDLAGGHVISH